MGRPIAGTTVNVQWAVSIVAAVIALSFMGSTLVTPLYTFYQRSFGFSNITLTLIYAIYVLGNLAAPMLFGRLSDQIGRRPITLIALGIAVVATVMFLFARGTPTLFGARALSGFAIGLATGTAAAWLADLNADDKRNASLESTTANAVGAGVGPLVAGIIAQYSQWPLRLPFLLYIPALLVVGAFVFRAPETVKRRASRISFEPRIGVPNEIRADFIAPAVTVFGTFALLGYYASLVPTVLGDELHRQSPLLAGGIVAELFFVTAIVIYMTRNMNSRTATLADLWFLLPSIATLLLAQELQSVVLMLLAAALCGTAARLGYRGTLQVVNELAPRDRRAEVVSAFFIVIFAGNSIPVIGIGLVSAASNAVTASLLFGLTIGIFVIGALALEMYRGIIVTASRPR